MNGPTVVITDDNYELHAIDSHEGRAKGLIPRDYSKQPHGGLMHAKPFDLPLIPESEWQGRLDLLTAAKARLSDVRNRGMGGKPIPSRDQDGKGYCWAHSTVSACLIARAVNNEPYADLSAYAVACIIKGYRDQGGWGGESLEWVADNGVPTSATWPQQSMSRSNDNPAMRAEAGQNKITEWMDLDPQAMKAQLVTCLLLGIPVVSDFNWWSHSVCTIDLVSINPFSTRIWNSWGDSWSDNGTGLLTGNRAIPDSAVAPRVVMAGPV